MVRSAIAIAMLVAMAGCADEIVGEFAATIAMGGSGGATGADESTGSTGIGGSESSSSSSSSSGTAIWEGGCYSDNFDDSQLDDTLWWSWVEGDAGFMESAGWMKFDPPTFGLLDTGLVTNNEHRFAFDSAWSRMQIVTPPVPDRPVVAFLQVLEDPAVVSISLAEGVVSVSGSADEGVNTFAESHPELGTPGWVGIRAEEPNVHFEVSDDGINWTTFATFPKPAPLEYARPLIMVQTYGSYPDRMMVAVDNFETCVD